jgi:2-oxoglutarate dehydrogenase E2 component (dihydrolipoamide succinyltransferase)
MTRTLRMPREIAIPTVGESITEGTLTRWLKQQGDVVREGEALFELETDKATSEVPSPATGRLHITTKEGQAVQVGAVIGTIDESVAAPAEAKRKAEVPKSPEPARPKPPPDQAFSARASPAPSERVQPQPPDYALSESAILQPSPPGHVPSERAASAETRQPMSRLRKTIAERLVAAQKSAAILSTFNECDMTQVMAARAQFKDTFKERYGVGLGFMAFFLKAAVHALQSYPVVNARIDGDDIVYHNEYHVGVAVSTDRGLIVPVVRHADRLSFAELEKAVAGYAEKARSGKIEVDDLRGGTFTITNGGVFGSLLSTPLLNPPQSAILGLHAIKNRPVAVSNQVVVRPMMYLALSYDHRLIDGREAVLFLVRVKELIEDPARMLVGV